MAEHADRALARVVEAGDQRKQRRLAGAIQTQKGRESRGRHDEGNIDQRFATAVAVADVLHLERGRAQCRNPHVRLCARTSPERDCRPAHWGGGATATPQGKRPTGMDLITSSLSTSITEMSLESPLVVSRYRPSGVNAICHTR